MHLLGCGDELKVSKRPAQFTNLFRKFVAIQRHLS
jgi:hypothetical protein